VPFFWVKPRNFQCQQARLEVAAADGDVDAIRVLDLRKDSNFTLCKIIWCNVVTNVLLTLLSDSVLAGLGAFLFSTIVITFLAELSPGLFFTPRLANGISAQTLVNFYEVLLFPVAKPTAALLNLWLGGDHTSPRAGLSSASRPAR
jgi:metal transporter CNNM